MSTFVVLTWPLIVGIYEYLDFVRALYTVFSSEQVIFQRIRAYTGTMIEQKFSEYVPDEDGAVRLSKYKAGKKY